MVSMEGTHMNTAPAPKFRKIMTGLYGTGVCRNRYHNEGIDHLCDCQTVEVVLDMYTTPNDGCWERYMCCCGNFTDTLGEWFPTLRDAKAFMLANPERIG